MGTARSACLAAAATLLLAGCGGGDDEPKVTEVPGLRGSLVDVGDHLLYFECAGKGSPTVVLEAGHPGYSHHWRDVQPAAARLTRVCSYDRAGLGASPRPEVERTRTAQTDVDDLERLLENADIERPYVFVGHSYGGMIARLFAGQHRDAVVGIVLVDSSHPDIDFWVTKAIESRARDDSAMRKIRATITPQPIVAGVDFRRSAEQVRAVRSLGALPLVVLTRGKRDWFTDHPTVTVPEDLAQEVQELWLKAHRQLAHLSSNSIHGVALESGHFIQDRLTGQPQVVLAAIEAVVKASRDKTRLPTCRRLFSRAAVACEL